MEEYRPTLLGRALADVLQEMERDGAIAEADSDVLFAMFDHAMRAEFAAAEPKPRKSEAPPTAPTAPPLFTHRSMDLQGTAQSFNRFMDKWTVHATLSTTSGDSLRLEGVPLELPMGHVPAVDIVVKLHDLPKKTTKKRRR
jgi:hypothetical protein